MDKNLENRWSDFSTRHFVKACITVLPLHNCFWGCQEIGKLLFFPNSFWKFCQLPSNIFLCIQGSIWKATLIRLLMQSEKWKYFFLSSSMVKCTKWKLKVVLLKIHGFNCPRSRLNLLSRSASCLRNPSLGRTSRWRRTSVKASTAVMFCLSIK